MVFSSLTFLAAFLPCALLLDAACPLRFRRYLLLTVSLAFAAFGGWLSLGVMAFSMGVNGVLSRYVARRDALGRGLFVLGIGLNLVLLLMFKYLPPMADTVTGKAGVTGLTLPVGISFYTFQGMALLLDVRHGRTLPPKRLTDVLLYIAFFPQLVAGPILRYEDFAPQLDAPRPGWNARALGLRRFISGLSKKVLLAGSLGVIVDGVMAALPAGDAPTAWLGLIAYGLQIYLDFSGYCDMAVGLGRMLGFTLPENFDLPYTAASLQDFWRRWHMTLQQWLRDYVYIPLGGSRSGHTARNLLIVFALTGVWHGAGLTYLCWGLWHGLWLVVERRHPLRGWPGRAWTLLVVTIGWAFFRGADLGQSAQLLGALVGQTTGVPALGAGWYLDGWNVLVLVVSLAVSLGVPARAGEWLTCHAPRAWEWMMAASGGMSLLLLLWCVAALVGGGYDPFIYFQF